MSTDRDKTLKELILQELDEDIAAVVVHGDDHDLLAGLLLQSARYQRHTMESLSSMDARLP